MRAVALVLHGGRARGTTPVHARQLAVLRMAPFASSLRHAGAEHGLAVARLRYLVRGWNGAAQSPVPTSGGRSTSCATASPTPPIALVGHSMGGRAALYAADHAGVQAVVGLAPWIEPGDPVEQLAGRRVLIAHGDQRPHHEPGQLRTLRAQAARAVAASVSYVEVRGEKHAMLRRAAVWHALTTGYVLGALLDVTPDGRAPAGVRDVVGQALAGRPALVV